VPAFQRDCMPPGDLLTQHALKEPANETIAFSRIEASQGWKQPLLRCPLLPHTPSLVLVGWISVCMERCWRVLESASHVGIDRIVDIHSRFVVLGAVESNSSFSVALICSNSRRSASTSTGVL